MALLEPKRIHELTSATALELQDGDPVLEVEVWNGVKWVNRKTVFSNASGGGSGQIINCGGRTTGVGELIKCGNRV